MSSLSFYWHVAFQKSFCKRFWFTCMVTLNCNQPRYTEWFGGWDCLVLRLPRDTRHSQTTAGAPSITWGNCMWRNSSKTRIPAKRLPRSTKTRKAKPGLRALQPLNHPSAPAYVWTCSFQPWGSIWECHGITYFRILPSPESYPFIGLNPFRNCLTVSTCGLWLSGIWTVRTRHQKNIIKDSPGRNHVGHKWP